MDVPAVTREQMAEIDRAVPGEYGITISRMMENAGYQVADFVRKEIDPEGVTVYAGKGNNGGDALAAARRLHLWNYSVEVVLATRDLDGIRKEELEILEELGVEIHEGEPGQVYGVALDGLIGYNLEGDPRPPFDSMIEQVNRHGTVVSIDLPSGVDADTGEALEPAVDADCIVTLALPLEGLEALDAEVYVADISIPPEVYDRFGIDARELFSDGSTVRTD